jgi:hypothetical protein
MNSLTGVVAALLHFLPACFSFVNAAFDQITAIDIKFAAPII